MSGAGRKHRAKGATREFLDDAWDGQLNDGDYVAVVTSTSCGAGRFEVGNIIEGDVPALGTPLQVTLPGKFQKVIWILRGDVVLHNGDAIVRKVSDQQLKRLAASEPVFTAALQLGKLGTSRDAEVAPAAAIGADASETESESDSDADIFVNSNHNARNARANHGFSDSEEDEEDDS
jgi:hypothetical protein